MTNLPRTDKEYIEKTQNKMTSKKSVKCQKCQGLFTKNEAIEIYNGPFYKIVVCVNCAFNAIQKELEN